MYYPSIQHQFPYVGRFSRNSGIEALGYLRQEAVRPRGIVTCSKGKAIFPLAKLDYSPLGQGSRTNMEQRPGEQPSTAQKKEVQAQPETLSQTVSGRGRVLLIREFLKQEESYTTLQNFPGQPLKDLNAESSYSQATDFQRSSSSARRGLKRTGDCLTDSPEAPATKSKRLAEKPEKPEKLEKLEKSEKLEKQQLSDLKEKDLPDCEAPRALPEASSSETAEIAELGSEPGKQLLLVLCHASALGTQLPRLQLLLQQVRVQDRRPPAALVGILVHPRPDEEVESRRRLEELLCSVFASENPGVEVHTAVFCPNRPQGVLDVQRAASQVHMDPLMDRQTQTDGEGPKGGDWDCCSPEK